MKNVILISADFHSRPEVSQQFQEHRRSNKLIHTWEEKVLAIWDWVSWGKKHGPAVFWVLNRNILLTEHGFLPNTQQMNWQGHEMEWEIQVCLSRHIISISSGTNKSLQISKYSGNAAILKFHLELFHSKWSHETTFYCPPKMEVGCSQRSVYDRHQLFINCGAFCLLIWFCFGFLF